MRPPTRGQAAVLIAGAVVCLAGGLALYAGTGNLIVDRHDVMAALDSRGYQAAWLLPMCFYLVLVNATLEELFWRGVVFNELQPLDTRLRPAGTLWTAVSFAGWHYLVFRALLQPGWAEVVVAVLLALALSASWLYKCTGSIVLPVLWHAFVIDLPIMAVFVSIALAD